LAVPTVVSCRMLRKWHELRHSAPRRSHPRLVGMYFSAMHHFVSQLIDLLLVLLAGWSVLAIIFAIYAYFARLKYPVGESVFGRVVVISFFIITTSIWLPIIVGALVLSLIGYLWSRFSARSRK
jgi:hypothetical protein